MRPRVLGSLFAIAAALLGATACGGGEDDPPLLLEAVDSGETRSPVGFWGRVDCDKGREGGLTPAQQRITTGGDPHPPFGAASAEDSSFRRLTVYDGDDVFGERCELGLNDHFRGPTAFYEEGERYVTYVSLRLPGAVDIFDPDWRVVLQMKQAQPYNNPRQASIFDLQVRGGRWQLSSDDRRIWSAPAEPGLWTRFAFDVSYSQDPSKGSVQVRADLNGDGDFVDDLDGDGLFDEASDILRLQTLVPEKGGEAASGLAPGESIPSHLRAGIYQNESYPCPRSGPGCSVDVDNVQVIRL